MDDSLLADAVRPDAKGVRRKLAFRRVVVTILVFVVLLGALGLLGVRSRAVRATANGYTLTVQYAHVARSGLDAPWRVLVHHPNGFSDDIELAVTATYFELFESQGFDPEPSAETADGEYVYLTFDRPSGTDFRLSFDAYVQPSAQLGADGQVRLLIAGRQLTHVGFRTWLLP
ncbi:hypothetical protein [Cryptosporangium japonicum]|uniref:DUF1850 domain-containing protein n=1 Tax=Cryptosporangium japonicum TaxID=80872 RepID=A0ABN0UQ48_9ACTN